MQKAIDINADLGEGCGFDNRIMPLISSCNIACGGHFGDEDSITEALQLAKKHKVKVGAHPSYPDRENFGRKILKISKEKLKDSLLTQLRLIQSICDKNEIELNHVILHGALYKFDTIEKEVS
ncbi:MAG: LamB/YcsF family protein, partial [Flavobacteriaceae bacterium]